MTTGVDSGPSPGRHESSLVGVSAVALLFVPLVLEGVTGICDTSSSSGGIDGGMVVQSDVKWSAQRRYNQAKVHLPFLSA